MNLNERVKSFSRRISGLFLLMLALGVVSKRYRQEIKKIAPPVGNQGIDLLGSVMLDSISLVNCKNIQRLNDKNSFKVVSGKREVLFFC